MTLDEARKVKVGDVIATTIGGATTRAFVESIIYGDLSALLSVRRVGKTTDGRKFPSVNRNGIECQLIQSVEAIASWVCADWLDENGEPEAARKLREKFPMEDSK